MALTILYLIIVFRLIEKAVGVDELSDVYLKDNVLWNSVQH